MLAKILPYITCNVVNISVSKNNRYMHNRSYADVKFTHYIHLLKRYKIFCYLPLSITVSTQSSCTHLQHLQHFPNSYQNTLCIWLDSFIVLVMSSAINKFAAQYNCITTTKTTIHLEPGIMMQVWLTAANGTSIMGAAVENEFLATYVWWLEHFLVLMMP